MAFRAYYQSFSSPLAFRQFSFVPHTLYTFPSRISCRIIGCDSSSLDTFTYRLLMAESYKYRVTNLYRACGDFRVHAVAYQALMGVLEQRLDLAHVLHDDAAGNRP